MVVGKTLYCHTRSTDLAFFFLVFTGLMSLAQLTVKNTLWASNVEHITKCFCFNSPTTRWFSSNSFSFLAASCFKWFSLALCFSIFVSTCAKHFLFASIDAWMSTLILLTSFVSLIKDLSDMSSSWSFSFSVISFSSRSFSSARLADYFASGCSELRISCKRQSSCSCRYSAWCTSLANVSLLESNSELKLICAIACHGFSLVARCVLVRGSFSYFNLSFWRALHPTVAFRYPLTV